jgi:protein-disulfide isomerase
VFEELDDWESYAIDGNRMGPASAQVVLVEFSDFQCPWCARYARTLAELREKYPNQFAVVYRHWPISGIHPYADTAAVASECAADQGRFGEMHDVLFAGRDSIGKLPWRDFARRAAVADLAVFEECLLAGRVRTRIRRDSAAGAKLEIRGTPTSIINGVRVSGSLPMSTLDSLIQIALKGQGG